MHAVQGDLFLIWDGFMKALSIFAIALQPNGNFVPVEKIYFVYIVFTS